MRKLEFWYEYASTYSYPCAMRIGAAARTHRVNVIWRPFLLGPIFRSFGWPDSPFNLFPAKGRYMWRDMERRCARQGLPFARPSTFPQNSLLASRIALNLDERLLPSYTRAVFVAEFGCGWNIADRRCIRRILEGLGLDADNLVARADDAATKQRLRDRTSEAAAIGIIGAPTLRTPDGELFWGGDRLDDALEWVSRVPSVSAARRMR